MESRAGDGFFLDHDGSEKDVLYNQTVEYAWAMCKIVFRYLRVEKLKR